MIQIANPDDTEEISLLNRQLRIDLPCSFPWDTPEWIAEEIAKGNYYVYRDREGIAGALCLRTDPQNGNIEAMAIRSNTHGQGIGRKLVEFAVSRCRLLNIGTLSVHSFCLYGVRPFYEKCGFTCVGDNRTYHEVPYYSFSMSRK